MLLLSKKYKWKNISKNYLEEAQDRRILRYLMMMNKIPEFKSGDDFLKPLSEFDINDVFDVKDEYGHINDSNYNNTFDNDFNNNFTDNYNETNDTSKNKSLMNYFLNSNLIGQKYLYLIFIY